jgi:hypothetical protein
MIVMHPLLARLSLGFLDLEHCLQTYPSVLHPDLSLLLVVILDKQVSTSEYLLCFFGLVH